MALPLYGYNPYQFGQVNPLQPQMVPVKIHIADIWIKKIPIALEKIWTANSVCLQP